MALSRSPARYHQEILPPPLTTVKVQMSLVEMKDTTSSKKDHQTLYQRRTKRRIISIPKRRLEVRAQQIPRPANNDPFPFFNFPREIRDQVYSYLVVQPSGSRPIIAAGPLLRDRKRRVAAQAKRERLNRKRLLTGRPLSRIRQPDPEPLLHLQLLQVSQRLCNEARDCLYSSNWFAITLDKLPMTTFEAPFGWNLSRITRLQIEVQLKDAAHMNSYVDWMALLSAFSSLRFLHIAPTFHPRYYDWAFSELSDWTAVHFVHKAFFRELLAAIPSHVDVKFGTSAQARDDMQLQGTPLSETVVQEMYAELGFRRSSQPHVRPASIRW
jgi:hypothetical protein